jgi:signal transduction histidine kinase
MATATNSAGFSGLGGRPNAETPAWAFLLLVGATLLGAGALLVASAVGDRVAFTSAGWGLAIWVAAVALVDFAALPSGEGPQLVLDLPVLLAAGFLFGPLPAGVVAFAGYVDSREWRGEVSLVRALYNRSQVTLSVAAGAAVFQSVGGVVGEWPRVAFATLLAVGADAAVNYTMVALVMITREGTSLREALVRLRFAAAPTSALVYLCLGCFGLLIADIYQRAGAWSLALFVFPLLLARHAFQQNRRLEAAVAEVQHKTRAIQQIQARVVDERRDERLALAAELHDEVLPALLNVHLVGQVLRQELATGRLLEMEDDLPGLVDATDRANEGVRTLIRNLRRSPVGASGLAGTIELLVRQLQLETSATIEFLGCEPEADPDVQLVVYQVVREALRNALRHSRGTRVRVLLSSEDDYVRVSVEDDGVGFRAESVDWEHHFGLQLMRERTEGLGGIVQVSSAFGEGTCVSARLPIRARH